MGIPNQRVSPAPWSGVSIQLGSPASGDATAHDLDVRLVGDHVSIQLGSPASGDKKQAAEARAYSKFPFN